jgi:hypothetical protein
MPQLGQGQVGTLKSMPKLTKINGDDHSKVIYRNLGNNHAYPFIWATTATMPVGQSSVVVASGIKWHGYDLASYATVVATPEANLGSCYVAKNVLANTITVHTSSTATVSGTTIGLMFMLGGDLEVEGLSCRGNTGAAQNLP